MSNLVDLNPYGIYNDLQGRPLNNGKVYIGLPNQDPKGYPTQVYWDAAMTIPVAQPLRTVGGYVSRNGTPARVYINGNYSLQVTTSTDVQVFYVQDYFLMGSAQPITKQELSSSAGASFIGILRSATSSVICTLLGWINSKPASVYEFQTDAQRADCLLATPVLDHSNAIQAAINAAGAGGTIDYQAGATYFIKSPISLLIAQTHNFNNCTIKVDANITAYNRSTNGYPGRIKFKDFSGVGTGKTGKFCSITNNTPFVSFENFNLAGFGESVLLNGSYCSSFRDGNVNNNQLGITLLNECHASTLENVLFDRNDISNFSVNGDPGNGNRGTIPVHNITSIGCAYQNSQFGAWIENCYNFAAFNTYHEGNTKADLRLGVTDAGVYGRACYDFTIDTWQSASPCALGKNIIGEHAVNGKMRGLSFLNGTSTTGTLVSFDGFSDKIDFDYNRTQTTTISATVPFSFPAGRVTVSNVTKKYIPYGLYGLNFGTIDSSPGKIGGDFVSGSGRPALTMSSVGAGNDMQFIVNDVERHYNANSSVMAWQINHLSAFNQSAYQILPATDNALTLGVSSLRWSVIYAGTGTINTSDAREKQDIRTLSEKEKSVAIKLKSLIRTYKWKDSVSKKGDSARIHVGWIAQDVIAAFNSEGLNAFDYACCCYDEWPDQYETICDKIDEKGNIIEKGKKTITFKAGNRYGVRLDQIQTFIISTL